MFDWPTITKIFSGLLLLVALVALEVLKALMTMDSVVLDRTCPDSGKRGAKRNSKETAARHIPIDCHKP
jgi:hypothetical protein